LDTAYLNAWIDSNAVYLKEGQTRNFIQWPILGTYVWPNPSPIPITYQGEIDRLKQWISDRMVWLDANMPGNCWDVSVAENNFEDRIYVYPDPTTGKFAVESSELRIEKIEVLDIFGRVVQIINAKNSETDISNLPEGIYILKIYSGTGFSLHKIIKAD
jgi:hypothetical protein